MTKEALHVSNILGSDYFPENKFATNTPSSITMSLNSYLLFYSYM